MKYRPWLFAIVVLALSYSIMFRPKRLDSRWVALGNRRRVVECLSRSMKDFGAGACSQILDEILPSQYKSRVRDFKLLSQSSGDYYLIVHEKNCVSFVLAPATSDASLLDRTYHLGSVVVEESSDSRDGRYILGFECGKAFYVDGDVKEAIEHGRDCRCVMMPDTRCWRILRFEGFCHRSGRIW